MSFREIDIIGRAFNVFALGILLRSTALALLCGVMDWALRKRCAEIRHALWRGMLVALMLLPGLEFAVPPLLHSPVTGAPKSEISALAVVTVTPPAGVRIQKTAMRPEPHVFPWGAVVLIAYLLVAAGLGARLLMGLRRIGKIAGRSRFIGDPGFAKFVHRAWLESESPWKPRVRASGDVRVPLAMQHDAEIFVLLPANWPKWSLTKLRVILAHELCHVKRNDPATALLACMVKCVFWFHPLAWFLQRRLATLAEQACDEFVLQRFCEPDRYANMLVEFAREVSSSRVRALQMASALLCHSRLAGRIHRILDHPNLRYGHAALVRLLAFGIFIPALYLAAAARSGAPQAPAPVPRLSIVPSTPEQVAELEQQLSGRPEDLDLHRKLLVYYMNARMGEKCVRELRWMVEHHPEDPLATGIGVWAHGGWNNTPSDYQRLAAAWEQALNKYPSSPDVLFHAGVFFESGDPERALELFRQAQQLDVSEKRGRYREAFARIYAAAFIPDTPFQTGGINMTADLRAKLRNELESSTDPALVSQVGSDLVRIGVSNHADSIKSKGFEFLERAIDMDPLNPALKDALEAAKAEPVREQNYRNLTPPQTPPGAVRVSAEVAEGNLQHKVDPHYPPLALAARIQGTVQFTATIASDGHIAALTLVSGHPLLVEEARKAVLQWTYKPMLLNRQAVPVVTTIRIPFRLPE